MSKSIRISDEVFQLLKDLGVVERRSVSAEAQLRLERSLTESEPAGWGMTTSQPEGVGRIHHDGGGSKTHPSPPDSVSEPSGGREPARAAGAGDTLIGSQPEDVESETTTPLGRGKVTSGSQERGEIDGGSRHSGSDSPISPEVPKGRIGCWEHRDKPKAWCTNCKAARERS